MHMDKFLIRLETLDTTEPEVDSSASDEELSGEEGKLLIITMIN